VILGEQLLSVLDPFGVERNTVHGAYHPALRLVMMADALGTPKRVDLVNLRPHADGRIRTFGLAYIAIDALIGDQ
jgi:hypothetical protein